jgi:predicted nucleic acid-binding protein
VFAAWLDELHTTFADRIVPIDIRVAEEWGRLNATRPRNTVDSLIAATARVHGLTVVTRNTGDFEGCGVTVLNPWQPQSDPSG